MSSNVNEHWKSIRAMFADALQSGSEVIAEAERHGAESAAVIKSAFDDMGANVEAVNARMAGFRKEFEDYLNEARKAAAAAKEHRPNDSTPTASKAPAEHQPPVLPGNLAPVYARQLLARYANAPVPKPSLDPGDSRVWFDSSLVGDADNMASELLSELRGILSGVSNRVAVWWTCVALSDALQSEFESMPSGERRAIERSVEWVLQPTPDARSSLAALRTSEGSDSLATALGSLFNAIDMRDPNATAGEYVAGAATLTVQLACRRQSPAAAIEVMRRARNLARDMTVGKRLWTENAGESSTRVSDSLATFSRWSDG